MYEPHAGDPDPVRHGFSWPGVLEHLWLHEGSAAAGSSLPGSAALRYPLDLAAGEPGDPHHRAPLVAHAAGAGASQIAGRRPGFRTQPRATVWAARRGDRTGGAVSLLDTFHAGQAE